MRPHWQIKPAGGPTEFARQYAVETAGTGVDVLAMYHDTWQAVPIAVGVVSMISRSTSAHADCG